MDVVVNILRMARINREPGVYAPCDCWLVDGGVDNKCFMGATYDPVEDKLTIPVKGNPRLNPEERQRVTAEIRRLLLDAKIISD